MASASLDWEQHREAMRALYVDENKTLKDVMDVMKGPPYHFSATKKQYERQFQKKWRFRKNLTKQDWKILHFKVSKRQNKGKATKIFVDGRLQEMEKLEHEISRYGFSKSAAIECEPKTPDGISLRSPTPISPIIPSVEISHATRLMSEPGSTSFHSIVIETPSLVEPTLSSTRFHGFPYFELFKQFDSRFQAARGQLALLSPERLTTFVMVPHGQVQSGKESSLEVVASKQASLLQEMLPPRADGLILPGNASFHTLDPQVEFLTNAAYLLYNGLGSSELSASMVQFFSVPGNRRAMEHLMSSPGIATKAFAEKLVLSLLETCNDTAAVQALERGQVAPHAVHLVEASRTGCLRTVKLLLERGINPNSRPHTRMSHSGYCKTALEIAVLAKNNLLAKQLVELGANPNSLGGARNPRWCALVCAIDMANLDLLDYFLHSPTCQNSNKSVDPYQKALWLLIAADKGDIDLLAMLLPHVNINQHTENGYSALSAAALRGRHSAVAFLLSSGASPNRSDTPLRKFSGPSPLQAAITAVAKGFVDREDLDTIRLLIKHGADVNAPRGDSSTAEWSGLVFSRRTAIQAAAEIGHEELFFYLLSLGADPNTPSDVFFDQSVVSSGSEPIRNFLSRASIRPDLPPIIRPRKTGLFEAVSTEDGPAVRRILESGCDVNETGSAVGVCTALSVAILKRDMALVQLLLDFGADINHRQSSLQGGTALQAAMRMKNTELVKKLISLGADVFDDEALAIAIAASPSDMTTAMFSAIETNMIPAQRQWSMNGQLALNAAIRKGEESIVLKLIQFGISPYEPACFRHEQQVEPPTFRDTFQRWFWYGYFDHDFIMGENALATAIRVGKKKIVEILIGRGWCIDYPLNRVINHTPLEYAAKSGHSTIVQLLLDRGADCKASRRNPPRGTALKYASIGGFIGMAQILLAYGADPNESSAPSLDGTTALEGAAAHGRLDMLQLLLDAGADLGDPKSTSFGKVLSYAYQGGHMVVVDFLKEQQVKIWGSSFFNGNIAEEISFMDETWKFCGMCRWSYQEYFGHRCSDHLDRYWLQERSVI